MKTKLISAVAFTAVVAGGYLAHNIQKQSDEQLSDLMIENIEALADGEGGNELNYGCGYAAYEWDNDWYEDTKHFSKCKKGCPEGSGTDPKYIFC